jgi:thiamine-phosphate pyrophosphorylase
MELPRIQYITHPEEDFEDYAWLHRLSAGGVKWIQLRIKEEDFYDRYPDAHFQAYLHEKAAQMQLICDALGLLLTVNDHAEVAVFSNAGGVHVGQEDADPAEVRALTGPDMVIGLTANSLRELEGKTLSAVDYVGVGPFQSTSTKQTNKPFLGLNGYRALVAQFQERQLALPVFAIGGIEREDIQDILKQGVYGIALSGLIFRQGHEVDAVRAIMHEIEQVYGQA